MAKILPAGQHYGATLRSWNSGRVTVSRIRYDRDTGSDLHGNEHASVMFVEEGLCVKQMGGQLVELPRETGLFLPPGWLQKDSFPESTTFLAAEFSEQFITQLREVGWPSDEPLSLPAANSHPLRTQLRAELLQPDSFSPLVLEGMLMSTVALAGRMGSHRARGKQPVWLIRAKEILHESIGHQPSMDDMARLTGVHPAHLSREFQRHFGCSLGEYGRRIRVEQAKTQLISTKLPLAEISLRNGFSDQAHFSRAFKRYTGSTPLQYRRNLTSYAADTM
jgi:AraC family transcriptional regulator